MKRSTTIGLAAMGFVAVAGVTSCALSPNEEPIPSEAMNACTVGGVRTARECAEDFKAARAFYEKEVAPTLTPAMPVTEGTQELAAAAPTTGGGGASSSQSSNGNSTLLQWYLWNQMMNSNSGRSGYHAPGPSMPFSPSSAFQRSTNPSSYQASLPVARTAPPVAHAPSSGVVSRGGFGSTSTSMGMSASS